MTDSIDKVVSEMRATAKATSAERMAPIYVEWADRLSALHVVPEWLPIESAPKDGTKIWAFNPTFEEQCVLQWSAGTEWSGWLYTDAVLNDCLAVELTPTHWQPLPPDVQEAIATTAKPPSGDAEDARRYRWLRDRGFGFAHDEFSRGISVSRWGYWPYDTDAGHAAVCDAAIDAAMLATCPSDAEFDAAIDAMLARGEMK